MLIRLAEIIEDEPFAWSDEHALGRQVLEEMGIAELEELSWGGTVTKTLTGHLFEARLGYIQTLACRRCLEAVKSPVEAEITLVVESRASEPTSGEVELESDDLDVLYVDGEVLDTEPILVEQIELNLSMSVLCRKDCKGLCPSCGANLNNESCDCGGAAVDPRWTVLETLRSKTEGARPGRDRR